MPSQSSIDEKEPGSWVAAIGSFIPGTLTKKQGLPVGHRADLRVEEECQGTARRHPFVP